MVSEGDTIKIHYTLTVDGEVVDSSEGREPMEFKVGRRQVIPAFDNGVKGMKVGDKKSFQASPEEGYGQEDPRGIQEIPKSQLPPDIEPKVGMTLYATGSAGQTVSLRVSEVKEDSIVVNMNHPLAGKLLNFEVELVEIH